MDNITKIFYVAGILCVTHTGFAAPSTAVPGTPIATKSSPVAASATETNIKSDRDTKDFVDVLIEALSSDDPVRQRFGLLGLSQRTIPASKGIPLYHSLLKKPSLFLQQGGAEALGQYGVQAKIVVPDLIRLLEAEDDAVAIAAVSSLSQISPKDPNVISALIRTVEKNESPSLTAVTALTGIGPAAKAAIPSLIAALGNPLQWEELSYAAYIALAKIQSTNDPSLFTNKVDALSNLDKLPPEKSAAVFLSIQESGPSGSALLPQLKKIVETRQEPYYRIAAINALASIGPGADEEAVKILVKSLSAGAGEIPRSAEKALRKIGEGDIEAVTPLSEALVSSNGYVREVAARALSQIGPAAKAATPNLIKTLREEINNTNVSFGTVNFISESLVNIGPRAHNTAPVLIELLGAKSTVVKKSKYEFAIRPLLLSILAAVGLPQDEASRGEVLQIVSDGLRSGSPYVRAGAARLAGLLTTDAAPVVPLLTEAIRPDARDAEMTPLFQATMMGLPNLTNKERPLLQESHEGHKEGLTTARLEAIRALARIGAGAAPAIPLLKKYAESKDGEIVLSFYREDARQALALIEKKQQSRLEPKVEEKIVSLGAPILPVSFSDVKGATHGLSSFKGKMTLFVFADTQCPCVQSYTARMRVLENKFKPRGLQIIYAFSSPNDKLSEIRKFAEAQKFSWTVIHDQQQKLLRMLNASCTMESFLLDKKGVLRYRGRVDDNTYKPQAVRERNLENAINALLTGQPVQKPETGILSCGIPRI